MTIERPADTFLEAMCMLKNGFSRRLSPPAIGIFVVGTAFNGRKATFGDHVSALGWLQNLDWIFQI